MRRRDVLKGGVCSLLGSAALVNTVANLKLANAAVLAGNNLAPSDHKALVCLFLFGGNDSFNMLLPAEKQEHELYSQSRGALAVPLGGPSQAIPLKPHNTSGRVFGLHPAMSEVGALFKNKQIAFVANVGTLAEPTTIDSYKSKAVKLPQSLFSHNSQREQWSTCLPDKRSATGWLGRTSDLLQTYQADASVSMNISLAGTNLMQSGQNSRPYSVSAAGSVKPVNTLVNNLFKDAAKEDMLAKDKHSVNNIFEQVFSQATGNSIEAEKQFSKAFDSISLKTLFPATSLGQQLQGVAKSIAAHKVLKQKRQTFFVRQGGWDTHQDQLESHPVLLKELSGALAAFQEALVELELSDQVVTFTASDFGRTLRSNGRGTDHGWGGNCMVMGDVVNGGSIYGHYPEALLIRDQLDVGSNGRILPTTSCDEYFSELLLWFGVSAENLKLILPNIDRFYSPVTEQLPLGIFN